MYISKGWLGAMCVCAHSFRYDIVYVMWVFTYVKLNTCRYIKYTYTAVYRNFYDSGMPTFAPSIHVACFVNS